MKKTVSIARALKEKNRVAGRIAKARGTITSKNSRREGEISKIDLTAVIDEEAQLVNRLIEIKTRIAEANHEIIGKIVELGEIKGRIAWLKELGTFEGGKSDCYGRDVQYLATIDESAKDRLLRRLQQRVEALQDEIDEHNGSRRIEIEIDENTEGSGKMTD